VGERCFLALWPDEDAQRTIDARVGALVPRGWRRPAARDLHLTLFFLGQIESDVARVLDGELAAVAARHGPLDLRLRGTGAFPSRGRERVLWLGVHEVGHACLAALQADVQRACTALGFAADERDWSPHLTLARAPRERRSGRVLDEFYEAEDFEISWQPAELTRVLSHAGSGADSRYEVAVRYALRRA
jgi:2'-5' RNA ligase